MEAPPRRGAALLVSSGQDPGDYFFGAGVPTEGAVAGVICSVMAFFTLLMFMKKTREFLSGSNILGWLI